MGSWRQAGSRQGWLQQSALAQQTRRLPWRLPCKRARVWWRKGRRQIGQHRHNAPHSPSKPGLHKSHSSQTHSKQYKTLFVCCFYHPYVCVRNRSPFPSFCGNSKLERSGQPLVSFSFLFFSSVFSFQFKVFCPVSLRSIPPLLPWQWIWD